MSDELTRQAARNMKAWLRGAYEPNKLTFHVRALEPWAERGRATFEATCPDFPGHTIYGTTQQEAIAGAVESIQRTCYRKLLTVLTWMEHTLPVGPDDGEVDNYQVPRWPR